MHLKCLLKLLQLLNNLIINMPSFFPTPNYACFYLFVNILFSYINVCKYEYVFLKHLIIFTDTLDLSQGSQTQNYTRAAL